MVVAPETDVPHAPADVMPPVRVVRDVEPYAGPLAGLAAGLTETDTPLALVVGGDMPGLVPDVLVELILVASEGEVSASALMSAGEVQPLPCALRVQALGVAQRLLAEDERSLKGLLVALEARAIPEETWRALDPAAATLHDIDEAADLES